MKGNIGIWRKESERKKEERKAIINFIIDVLLLTLSVYIAISLFSLIQVAMGEDTPYMPFWHNPWQFLGQLLKGGG